MRNCVAVGDAGQQRRIGIYPRMLSYLLWALLGKFSVHHSRSGLPSHRSRRKRAAFSIPI